MEADKKILQAQYPFPPITEAVIEFIFEKHIKFEDQQKISRKLNQFYPKENIESGKSFEFNFETDDVKVSEVDKIIQIRNDNNGEICSIGSNRITISKLPVYYGWENFVNRAKRDFQEAKSITGYRSVSRIGLRYINRVDIKIDSETVEPSKYFNIYVTYPHELGSMNTSAWRSEHKIDKIGAILIISLGRVDSPLPKHLGLLFDIDVAKVVDVPQKDDDIFRYLEEARTFKNTVFELSITDETRKSFFDDLRVGS